MSDFRLSCGHFVKVETDDFDALHELICDSDDLEDSGLWLNENNIVYTDVSDREESYGFMLVGK